MGDSLLGRRTISHRGYVFLETHWWHRAKRELILRLLCRYYPRKRIKILDVGCGTGKNVETFAKLGISWGIDMSKEAIAVGD